MPGVVLPFSIAQRTIESASTHACGDWNRIPVLERKHRPFMCKKTLASLARDPHDKKGPLSGAPLVELETSRWD